MGEVVNIDGEELSELIRELKMHDGWKVVDTFINGRIAFSRKQLEHCPIEQVQSYRDKIQAFQSVLNHVEELANPPQVEQHP